MKILLAAILFTNSAFASLSEMEVGTSTEAGVCEVCETTQKMPLDPIPLDKVEGATPADCSKKATLFDPKFKSYFEKKNIKLSYIEEENALFDSVLSCVYGLGRGAFLSAKALLMLIPFIVSSTVKLGKWSYRKAKEGIQDTSWVNKSVTTVKDFSTGVYKSTKDLATRAWDKASTTAKAGYQQAGVGGAASLLAVEAFENSPHHVVANSFRRFGSAISGFVGKEWDAFQCMSVQGKAQTLCSIMGYIVTDIATGKLIWGNLAKSDKILDAIEAAKKSMMRTPLVGDVMMKDYKKAAKTIEDQLQGKGWKVDGKLRLEGKSVDVVENEGRIFARGVDPKTREMTVYEVSGKTKGDIQKRLVESEKVGQMASAKTAKDQDNLFDPENPNIARTSEDFVRGTNREVAVDISDYHVKKVSQLFEKSPETAKEYGSVLKTVSDYQKKVALESPKKLTKEQKGMKDDIEKLLKEVNGSLAHSKPGETINLGNINRVIEEAVVTGDRKGLEVYKNAIASLNQAGGPSRFDTFFSNLGYNRTLSEELQSKVRNCLISKGVR